MDSQPSYTPPPPSSSKTLWLHAYTDPLAGLRVFPGCMIFCDVKGDGDTALLVADATRRLKVFRGTSLVSENALLEDPVGVVAYVRDRGAEARPVVAVAAGSQLFLYRNLRPYFKFSLPAIPADPAEDRVWALLRDGSLQPEAALRSLEELREKGGRLGPRSRHVLALESAEEVRAFVRRHAAAEGGPGNSVTCVGVLPKSQREEEGLGCLVLGTEAGILLILDPSAASVLCQVQLPDVPTMLAVIGQYDLEYRVLAACRNGKVYTVKNGEVSGVVLEMEDPVCGLVAMERAVYVGTAGSVVHEYHVKGKKQHTLYMPAPIACMELLALRHTSSRALIVALTNGELRVYNRQTLVDVVQLGDTVSAMRFGPYGREDNVLALAMRSGALHIKMTPRAISLDSGQALTGPPPEQDIPLPVPKASKLALEQAHRERSIAVEMHRMFQRDLCKLRLSTARAFVRILTDGQGPASYGGVTVRMTPSVLGLGPRFHIALRFENTGSRPLTSLGLLLAANTDLYRTPRPVASLPTLVPGLAYSLTLPIEVRNPEAPPEPVNVVLYAGRTAVPVMTAVLNLPAPELLLE